MLFYFNKDEIIEVSESFIQFITIKFKYLFTLYSHQRIFK